MKCCECGSERVHGQVITKKNPIVIGFVLALGGFGMMFLGIVGGIIGAVLGLIIGGIIKGIMGDLQETVFVCQDCGYTFSPNKK